MCVCSEVRPLFFLEVKGERSREAKGDSVSFFFGDSVLRDRSKSVFRFCIRDFKISDFCFTFRFSVVSGGREGGWGFLQVFHAYRMAFLGRLQRISERKLKYRTGGAP